ncbi:UDP-2,3-diacetamido-2,3-dideoxy-D-glucuronate 2-epimerase [compost metagenome]
MNELHRTTAPVIIPLHPRTRAAIEKLGLSLDAKTVDPLGYLEMIDLLQRCSLVLTDSGGLQKEAFFFGKYCLTIRDQTEWVELIEIGANRLVPADFEIILSVAKENLGRPVRDEKDLYGGGTASQQIVELLER